MARTKPKRNPESGGKREADVNDGAKGSSKKRKADGSEVAESSSKKARHEPESPIVKLPHTPGGTVPETQTKKRKSQPVETDTEIAEDAPQPPASHPLGPTTTTADNAGIYDGLPEKGNLGKYKNKPWEEYSKKARENIRQRWNQRVKRIEQRKERQAAEEEARLRPRDVSEERDASKVLERDVKMANAESSDDEEESDDKVTKAKDGVLSADVPEAKEAEQAVVVHNGLGADDSNPRLSRRQRQQKRKLELSELPDSERRARRKGTKAEKNLTKEKKENARLFQERAQELTREVKIFKKEGLAETAGAGGNVKATRKQEKQPAWSLSTSVGGRFINHDPIFAKDPATSDAVLIAATQREIQVLSVETSLPVRTYALRRGLSVCSFSLDPADLENVYVVCDNGVSFVWRWSVDASEPQDLKPSDAKVVVGGLVDDHGPGVLYLKDIKGSTAIWSKKSMYMAKKRLDDMQVLSDGEYIVAQGPAALVLGMRNDSNNTLRDYIWVEIPISIALTCMNARITHSEGIGKKDKRHARISLALGNIEGKIHLYDDIASVFAHQGQASLPTPRILHWHRESVSALKFSRDGSYLISGGKETVLVLWQLETGKKQFLPHLTSEIERIVVSPEGDRYAVQMGDNSIMVLSTSELKPVANFAGLQLACPAPDSSLTTLEYERETQGHKSLAAVLHSRHASQLLIAVPATQPKISTEAAEARPFLQTFDLRTSRHVTRQALTRNNVTDFNLGPERTPVAPPDTVHVAMSHDGQWLATVDEWMPPPSDIEFLTTSAEELAEERKKRREVYLKIWHWGEAQRLWTLSARVDAPHARAGKRTQGGGRVLALVADPVSAGFATVGEDGRVRVWKPKTRVRHGVAMKGEGDVQLVEWVCRRTVELPVGSGDARADSPLEAAGYEGGPRKACLAYSEDASLLAAALTSGGSTTTLVHFLDISSGEIKATKPGIAAGERLEHVGFLDRYFIAVVREAVLVWDLVTDTLQQRLIIPNGDPLFAVNSADGTFAVAVDSRVSVYKPAETRAVYRDDCHQSIMAVLAGGGSRGYTLLFEDATVRILASTGAPVRRALPDAPAATDAPEIAIEPASAPAERLAEDVEMTDVLALPATDTEAQGPIFDEAEDDRPVVRPEQLARIFDVGQSFAMQPVRDMFEAFVGLYGRRPLVQAAA
ncbi:hypothetical protein B0A55_06315 [Friedmanniomyces simplex]|uniref:Uncharacterized protein n=1 Tax=Friedmanniomyces simplex TaxID=329884 RepID=A0A4U0XEV6_9PEZI|nr:hypothetical protein B0A55_06315 [Friedmanniomyces simplex]